MKVAVMGSKPFGMEVKEVTTTTKKARQFKDESIRSSISKAAGKSKIAMVSFLGFFAVHAMNIAAFLGF